MNARQRVLAAYGRDGQAACLWCGSRDRLELDHIDGGHGEGNWHRRWLTRRLEYDLQRQYQLTGEWPPGFRVLCQRCHLSRHQKEPTMPARKGAKAVSISLDISLLEAIDKHAAQTRINRSNLIATTLEDRFKNGPQTERRQLTVTILEAQQALTEDLRQLTEHVTRLQAMVVTQQREQTTLTQKVNAIDQRLEQIHGMVKTMSERKGWLR